MSDKENIEWDVNAPVVVDPSDEPKAFFVDCSGSKIPIKCANCAMWQRKLDVYDGAPMCAPGKKIFTMIEDREVTRRMNEDLWSCNYYFVPKESAELLDLLPDTTDKVWALNHITQIVKSISRFNETLAKHKNGQELLDYAITVARQHHSKNTMQYTLPLLQYLASDVHKKIKSQQKAQQNKPRRSRSAKMYLGDMWEWTDLTTGVRISGWFHSISKRTSSIVFLVPQNTVGTGVVPTSEGNAVIKYSLRDWREKSDPKLIAKTAVVDTTKQKEV